MGGVTTGVLATVLVGATLWPRSGIPALPEPEAPAVATANARDSDITYEYGEMLRGAEVPVPAAGTTESAAPVTEPAEAPARVVLQAGSFRTREDAEGMRAQLLLLDLGPVSTREALLADGNVWHRVFIGPFASADAKRKAQQKLMQQNINTFSIAAPADMPMPPAAGTRVAPASPAPAAPAARAAGAGAAPATTPAATPATAPARDTANANPQARTPSVATSNGP